MSKDLYKDYYRVQSIRLPGYDYRNPGSYFITICTRQREEVLGVIKNGKIQLSDAGRIADECWRKIEKLNNHVLLQDYVIMPNHVHGILEIINTIDSKQTAETNGVTNSLSDAEERDKIERNRFFSIISPKSKSVSTLIRSFKAACTLEIKKRLNMKFKWQERFYDHIIRDLEEFENIRWYIRHNPRNWAQDVENIHNKDPKM